MPSCLCDAFLRDWVTSTAEGVRPPTWRPLSEHPDARFAPDVDCFRGKDLVLAFCTECRRRWYFSWDLKDDAFHAVPIGDELLAVLNVALPLERLVSFLLSPDYRYWYWAFEAWFDRYFRLAGGDLETAEAEIGRALETPGLRVDVVDSLGRRLQRIRNLRAERDRAARPRRLKPGDTSQS